MSRSACRPGRILRVHILEHGKPDPTYDRHDWLPGDFRTAMIGPRNWLAHFHPGARIGKWSPWRREWNTCVRTASWRRRGAAMSSGLIVVRAEAA